MLKKQIIYFYTAQSSYDKLSGAVNLKTNNPETIQHLGFWHDIYFLAE